MLGGVWLVWRVQFIYTSFDKSDFLINNFGSIRGNQKIFGKKKEEKTLVV